MIVFRTQGPDCEWAAMPALLAWDVTWEEIERLRKMSKEVKSNAADAMTAPARFESLAVETPELAKLFKAAGEPEFIRVSGRAVRDARPYRQHNADGEIDLSVDHMQVVTTRDAVWISCKVTGTDVEVYSDPLPLAKLIDLAGFKTKQAA